MSSSETLELDSGLSKIGRLQIALGHQVPRPRGKPRSKRPEHLARFRRLLSSDATRCLRPGFGRRISKVSVLFL